MITDRNEAFKHNSCKKIAQLAKVILTMSLQARDRNDEIVDISNDYENEIRDIVIHHRHKVENVSKQLIQFRKGCIDSSCKEYGMFYKGIKNDLCSLMNLQTEKLNSIIEEGKKLQKMIQTYQVNTLKDAQSALSSAEQLESDLKNQLRMCKDASSQSAVDSALKPILDKMTAIKNDSESRITKIRQAQANKISGQRVALTTFTSAELSKRKSKYKMLKSQQLELKESIHDIQIKTASTIKSLAEFFKTRLSERNFIVSETKKTVKSIKTDIKTLQLTEKENNKQHENVIKEANNSLSLLKNSHQNSVEKIEIQIKEQKHQCNHFLDSKENQIKQQQSALNSVREGYVHDFENECKKRNENHEIIAKSIEECFFNIEAIYNEHKNRIIEFQQKLESRKDNFKNKLSHSLANAKKNQLNETENIAKIQSSLIDSLKNIEENHMKNHNVMIQNLQKEMLILKTKRDEQKVNYQKEIDILKNNQENQHNDYQKNNLTRQNQRKVELQNAYERKIDSKMNQMKELEEKFQKDLLKKSESITEENNQKLSDFENEKNKEAFFRTEIDDYSLKMKKLKARLEVCEKMLEQSKDQGQKMLQNLQNEYINEEKNQRMIQRGIKKETQSLSEDYETKIQIEQVNVQKSIENISKLYDPDENARGCEIIEAIRKVQQTNNRTDDLLQRKRRSFEDLQEANKKIASDLQEQIDQYKNGVKEKLLSDELKKKKEKAQKDLDLSQKQANENIETLEKSISLQSKEILKQKEEIQKEMDTEEKNYKEQVENLQKQIENLQQINDTKKQKIEQSFEEQTRVINQNHMKNKEKSIGKIDDVKNLQTKFEQNAIKEKEKRLSFLKDEYSIRQKEINKEKEKEINNLIKEKLELDKQLKILLDKRIEYEIQQIEDENSITVNLHQQKSYFDMISQKDKSIQNLFADLNEIITFKENFPKSDSEQSFSTNSATSSSILSKISKPEKSKSIDPKSRRKPVLFSPQL